MSKRWLMRRNTRVDAAKPETVQELQRLIRLAGVRPIVPGGARRDYDAVNNANGMLLDLSLLREVHSDFQQEIIHVQPGVTIDRLWRTAIGNGWWPEVLPSRLEATVGACLAANISGANGWHAGSLGELVQ